MAKWLRFNKTLRELSEEEWTEEIKAQERSFLPVQSSN